MSSKQPLNKLLGETNVLILRILVKKNTKIGPSEIQKELENRYQKTTTLQNISKRCTRLKTKGCIKKKGRVRPKYEINTIWLEETIQALSSLSQETNEALSDASFLFISQLKSIFLVLNKKERRISNNFRCLYRKYKADTKLSNLLFLASFPKIRQYHTLLSR